VLLFGLGLGLLRFASARQSALLVPEVGAGFQFVSLTLETIEVKDFLGIAAWHDQFLGPIIIDSRTSSLRPPRPVNGGRFNPVNVATIPSLFKSSHKNLAALPSSACAFGPSSISTLNIGRSAEAIMPDHVFQLASCKIDANAFLNDSASLVSVRDKTSVSIEPNLRNFAVVL
jgi:hypothetical protein